MFQRICSLLLFLSLVSGGAFAQGLETTTTKNDWEEINFEFNSAVLSDGYPSLLRLSELLAQNPSYKVRLEGNADSIGSDRVNDRLARQRAETVSSFLIKYGAARNQVEVVSRGKRAPKVDNRTKEGRFINRRVDITVLDGQGREVGAGGVGDAIQSLNSDLLKEMSQRQQQCCTDILKRLDRLDEIVDLLKDLKNENARLRQEVDGLKQAHSGLQQQVQAAPPPVTKPEIAEITRKAAADALDQHSLSRFSILGVNAGADGNGDLTFTGSGRFFAPFRENFAVQAQGEFLRFSGRLEGQADIGLVNRFGNFQAGLFSSFKHVNLREFRAGGTLGQGAFTLDYLFGRGKVGLFGTKGFMNNAVIDRTLTGRNIWTETYLQVVDQVGASTTVGLFGKTWMEANLGYLKSAGHADRPGGTVRFVHPITNHIAFTLEGGMNETFLGRDNNGRVVAGLRFGNFIKPQEYRALPHPVPVDVPRLRFEQLTRTVRTGNDPPIADAGPDQIGIAAGAVTLDGSASYDPDGDTVRFQWSQIAGPGVSLSGMNEARAGFTAAEGQTYAFRLLVTDSEGGQDAARVTVTTRQSPRVRITRFTATPPVIQPGQSSVLAWQVEDADEVTIDGLGSVNPRAGTASVSPVETTTYRITARNQAGEISETVTVTVERPQTRILLFQATPTNITAGETATLHWQTENAQQVTISGLGQVAQSGSVPVTPGSTTTYTLSAGGPSGQVTSSVTVTVTAVLQAPRIIRFTAGPPVIETGQRTTLVWAVENATEISIAGAGNVDRTGTLDVSPTENTVYTLTARNSAGETTATVTVTVNPAQPPPGPGPTPADPATISNCVATPSVITTPGSSVAITFDAQNAPRVTMTGFIGPITSPVTVNPQTTTTYVIHAAGANSSQAFCNVTVTVNPPVQPPPDSSLAPVVRIAQGPLLVSNLRSIFLDASQSSSPENLPLTYQWTAASSLAVIHNPASATPQIQMGAAQGDYPFTVTVTDSQGRSSTGNITVRYSGR